MERLRRYKKSIAAILFAIVFVATSVFLTSFNSHAMGSGLSYTTEFDVNYAQPYCSDYSGYLSVLYYINGDEYYRLYTYFWTIQPHGSKEYSTNVFSTMYVTINSGQIIFEPSCVADCNYYTNICAYDTQQNLHILQTSANTNSFGNTLTENYGNCTIVGYAFGGNIHIRGVSDLKDVYCPTIHWNSSGEAVQLNTYLNSILNSLSYLETDVSDLHFDLIQIFNMNVLIDEKLSTLITWLSSADWRLSKVMDDLKVVISEQEKTNTWLGKIWESIQEFLGLEGEESTESLPDEEINSVLEEEDKLMQDTSEAENSLDFSIDSNSNNVVWNVMERILNANEKVFGAFIGIMTLGVITLLLNR